MVCVKKKAFIKNGSEIIFLHSNKKKMKEIIFLQSYFVLFILHFPNFLKQKLTFCFNFERISQISQVASKFSLNQLNFGASFFCIFLAISLTIGK